MWVDVVNGPKTSAAIWTTGKELSGTGNYEGSSGSNKITKSSSANGYSGNYAYTKWASDTSWKQKQTDAPLTTSGAVTSTSGFSVGMITHFLNNGTSQGARHLAILKKVAYTITCGSGVEKYTVTLNSNSPDSEKSSETITHNNSNKSTGGNGFLNTINNAYWHYEGYEFTGWSTDKNATEGNKNLSLTGSTGGTTYYAIWRPVNYPLVCYDVYTDDKNYAAEIRRASYYVYTGSVIIAGETQGADKDFVASSSSVMNLYYGAGGNAHYGFTYQGAFAFGKDAEFTSNTWVPQDKREYASEYQSISSKGVYYMAFTFKMAKPIDVLVESQAVGYGYSINLDEFVQGVHPSASLSVPEYDRRKATYSYNWFMSTGDAVVFYVENEHVLYSVLESGNYVAEVIASIVFYGTSSTPITLSTSIRSNDNSFSSDNGGIATFTINPIRLKLEPVQNAVFEYNGQEQEFPFGVSVDDDYYRNNDYSEEQIARFQAVLDGEQSGYAWYYVAFTPASHAPRAIA